MDKVREWEGTWDYGTLPPNIRLGRGCYLERKQSFERFRSERNPGLVLGDGVRVYTWTAFSIEPSGFVEIGDESILVGPALMCAERISVGNRVILSYGVTVADSDFHPLDPRLRRQDAIANAPGRSRDQRPPLISRPIFIEDDVWIGIGAIILKGVKIGKAARIGAGAVLTSDVPAGATVAGNPAVILTREGEGK